MCRFVVSVHTPGLNRAIVQAAEIIADAIKTLTPPATQIDGGTIILDPQGSMTMATPINNTKPQHITTTWTSAGTPTSPDSVDWAATPTGLGTLTPDATPAGGATFVANTGATGDVMFTATSHQAGLADFAQSITGTLTTPTAQIDGGTITLDPQP